MHITIPTAMKTRHAYDLNRGNYEFIWMFNQALIVVERQDTGASG
jgi:hypothetical protein